MPYYQHLLAKRLGADRWEQVEEMPHLDVLLALDFLAAEDEARSPVR